MALNPIVSHAVLVEADDTTTSFSLDFANPAEGDLILIGISDKEISTVISSIAYGGVAATLILKDTSDFPGVFLYGISREDQPATGETHTLSITTDSGTAATIGIVKLRYVNTEIVKDLSKIQTANKYVSSGTVIDQNIVLANDSIIIDVISARMGGANLESDHNGIYYNQYESPRAGGMSWKIADAGTRNMRWSGGESSGRLRLLVAGIKMDTLISPTSTSDAAGYIPGGMSLYPDKAISEATGNVPHVRAEPTNINGEPEKAISEAQAYLPHVRAEPTNINGEPAVGISEATGIVPEVVARIHALLTIDVATAQAIAYLPVCVCADYNARITGLVATAEAIAYFESTDTTDSVVKNISVYPTQITLKENSMAILRARLTPVGIEDTRVSWSSSNASVATVHGDGLRGYLSAITAGTATITAKTVDGGHEATCSITVVEDEIVSYETLKILNPNFDVQETLSNVEIIDLTITRELSGHHGIDFTLPVGVDGWNLLKRGKYVEAENQKYIIEKIDLSRSEDGTPTIKAICGHIFFEIENDKMPSDTGARATILEHLEYVLRNTGFIVTAVKSDNQFFNIERVVNYVAGETKFEAFQRIFNIFDGHYRLDNFNLEIIPPESFTDVSDVWFEYAVTNKNITKQLDDSDVITVLYATAEDMNRVVHAEDIIKELYRKQKIAFINFSDVRLWNNFEYISNLYLNRRKYPRITYDLSVAELKNITNIATLYPARTFDIDIGKVVTVKDTELGINVERLIQRYTYKPLQPDNCSSVIVGDKPFDITFEETRREGTVGEIEGEWVYDEIEQEWVFYPFDNYEEDEIGEDYTLTITKTEASCGNPGLRYRYQTGSDAAEKSVLTITETAHTSGTVAIVLEATFHEVAILENDTANQIAAKISAINYPGWNVSSSSNEITFTAKEVGAKRYSAEYRFGLTGAEGAFVTVKGREEAYVSEWRGAGFPFEQTFANGDTVEVEPDIGEPFIVFGAYTGDGEGTPLRTFVMNGNKAASMDFSTVNNWIEVITLLSIDHEEESITIRGDLIQTGRFGESTTKGFVWSMHSNPTLADNVISVGSGQGIYSGTLTPLLGEAANAVYYYRAYASATDTICGGTIVAYGQILTATFSNVTDHEVSIEAVAVDGSTITETDLNILPFLGKRYIADETTLQLEAGAPVGTNITFEQWEIHDVASKTSQKTSTNPYNLYIDRNYKIICYVNVESRKVTIEKEGGEGTIRVQIVDPAGQWYPVISKKLPTSDLPEKYAFRVWVYPDDGYSEEYEWEGAGDGDDPRLFNLESGHVTAKVIFKKQRLCKKRCIYISPEDPDPNLGEDGDVWLRHD